jgi:hypothetical protein
MVQSGQAARAAKKAADAKPKVGAKKLLKDAALTAVMFAGPGKFLKAGKIASEGAKVARTAVKKVGKDAELKAATSAAEVIKKEKYLKEVMARPVTRNRNVPRPSTKELSPREKAADIASKKSPVNVVKKKPMSSAEIKKTRATARKAKFDRVLTPRPKPKPNRTPLKPIDRSRGSNAPVKPKLSDEAQILENAKSNPKNWDIADQRKPSTIEKGRGNVPQPSSITKDPKPLRTEKRSVRVEARNARRAEKRDRRTDIRESKTPGFEKLQPVKRGVPRNAEQRAEGRANAEARARLAAKAKKGSKMSKRSTTNDPRNAASDAGNMREKLKEIDRLTAARAKKRAIGKGGNKISPELKAKVNATLGSSNKAKKGKALQNTFNKPKFSRNVTTGRLRATRPIKPVKK